MTTDVAKEKDAKKRLNPLDYTPDDGGLMDAWLDAYGEDWLYVPQLKAWFKWAGTHWQEDVSNEASRIIQKMLKAANKRIRIEMSANGTKERTKMLKRYLSATRRSRSRVSSVESLAANEQGLDARELDRLDVINFQNGSFDVEEMELRDHDRHDLLTACLPYEYDEEATSPSWRRYLEHLPSECMYFLQEFAGYALTTDTRFEIAVWLYGPPASGKSTFIAGLDAALGYRSGLLSLSAIEQDRFALANIPGKTLLVSTEQPALHMKATYIVNKLISGEPVKIDQKFKDAYKQVPYAKLLWAMNRFPIVNDANDGVFRRVKVVRFREVHNKQQDLKERFNDERAGIFNWMLDGLKRLKERGKFEIPEAVKEATEEFINENDPVRAFVKENCLVDMEYEESSSRLHGAFNEWCNENEFKQLSPYKLAQGWKRLGFERRKAPSGMFWCGLKLRQNR